jgi:hypothetical protein
LGPREAFKEDAPPFNQRTSASGKDNEVKATVKKKISDAQKLRHANARLEKELAAALDAKVHSAEMFSRNTASRKRLMAEADEIREKLRAVSH